MRQKPPGRGALVLGGFLTAAGALFALWTWQQVDLEVSRPSPLLLLALAIACLVGAAGSFGWALGRRRGMRSET